MFSNNLLDNISDMMVTAERKGNTFVVTDVLSKGENEKECESSTELLKSNSRTAEMIVVADRNGNTIVVKDNVVPSTNNENEGRRCNNRKYNNKNNNEEDNIDDDGSSTTATTLSTIISAVKSLSLSSSNSTNQLLQSPKQSPKQRRRNRITIATLMTGRRGKKLLYLFRIKSNSSDRSLSNEEKNVSTDDLDRLLHSSLSTTSSFDSYKCLGKTI